VDDMDVRGRHIMYSLEEFRSKAPIKREKFLQYANLLATFFEEKKGKKLLDIGFGFGMFLGFVETLGFECYGIDKFPYNVESAKEFTDAKLYQCDMNAQYPFPGAYFDVVSILDVIEHTENPLRTLVHIREYLKDDGLLFMTTPNGNWAYKMRRIPFVGIPDGTEGHINVKNLRYWVNVLKESGFDVVRSGYRDGWLTHIKPMKSVNRLIKRRNVSTSNFPLIRNFSGTLILVGKVAALTRPGV
jgi:SAM-dependent methyltransferase